MILFGRRIFSRAERVYDEIFILEGLLKYNLGNPTINVFRIHIGSASIMPVQTVSPFRAILN